MGKRSEQKTPQRRYIANKHIKRCSTSYVIREQQIKTTMRCHYISIGKSRIQNTNNTKFWKGCEAAETLIHYW